MTRVVGTGLGVLLIAGCGGEGQAAQDRRTAPDTPAASDFAATTEGTPTPEATQAPPAPTPVSEPVAEPEPRPVAPPTNLVDGDAPPRPGTMTMPEYPTERVPGD